MVNHSSELLMVGNVSTPISPLTKEEDSGKRKRCHTTETADIIDLTDDLTDDLTEEDSKRSKTGDSEDEDDGWTTNNTNHEVKYEDADVIELDNEGLKHEEIPEVISDGYEHVLHPKQQDAIDFVKQGANVFLTGPGGTGKSVVLQRIIEYLDIKYRRCKGAWAATASTGIAAVPIQGQTLHSIAGCGIPVLKQDFERCWDKRDEWRALKVLIIEEISMISGEFFDNLSEVICSIRGSEEPFGGIQLILCGDFLQLPPIPMNIHDIREIKAEQKKSGAEKAIHCNRGFVFQSKAWKEANFKVIQLNHNFRQSNLDFQGVLSDIRKGVITSGAKEFLQSCKRPLPETSSGIKATILYPKNKDVSQENHEELNRLSGPEQQFNALDSVDPEANYFEDDGANIARKRQILMENHFFKDCPAGKELRLKVNAQVMLVQNERRDIAIDRSNWLCNGSRGVVVRFTNVKGLEGDDTKLYPVVKFMNKREKIIVPEEFTSKLPGIGICKRQAIPLKLAWAVTIHKSQGMTLDYIKTDLSEVFTEAQTYVALSRATNKDGLELCGFSESKVMADKRALKFYENPNIVYPCWSEAWNQADEAIKVDPTKPLTNFKVPPPKKGCLQGKMFVFTGEPNYTSREEAESLVKACGGIVRGSISSNTQYLVIGSALEDGRDVPSGTKYQKAKEIIAGWNRAKLKILNELDFYDLVKKQSSKGPIGLHKFFTPKKSY